MTQMRRPRRFVSGQRPRLVLGGIAAASISLSGCADEPDLQDAQFTSVAECTKAGYPDELCQSSFNAAMIEQQKNAPSFKTLEECRSEWGENGCAPAYRSGSGSVFVPLMAGFVLSRLMQRDYVNNGYVNYYGGSYGSPIYRSRTGNTVTVDRSSTGAVTRTPVNVNTKSVASSGFGGMGMSRSSGGSFGS